MFLLSLGSLEVDDTIYEAEVTSVVEVEDFNSVHIQAPLKVLHYYYINMSFTFQVKAYNMTTGVLPSSHWAISQLPT